jgi:SLT domain-containing protein
VEIPARYGLPSTAELQKQLDNAPLNLPADLDLGGLKKQIGQLPGLGSGAAAAFSTGLEKGSPRVAQGAQQLSETLKKNLPGPEQMRSLGASIAENLAAGMTGRADQVAAAAQTLAERIISTVKSTFGIASPSAVFRDIGASMIQGLINGLKSQDINSIATKIFGGLPRALAAIFGGSSPGGDTSAWLSAALAATGAPPSWLPGLLRLVEAESGGNPRAVNPVAVGGEHATGLLQMLPSTFRAYALPGMGDIYNPVHNAAAAIRYIQARYGSIYNTPLFKRGPYKGYATGGIITHRHLAEVGEDGPEAIIPLSGHRERAVALLWQVGRILGVLRQNVAPAAGPVLSAGPSAAGILNTAPVPISSVQAAAELSPAHQATALPFGTRPAPEAQSISIPGAPAIHIHPGAITIHQAPGQDAGELVRAVFRELFPMIVREYEKMIRDRRRNTGVTPVFVR